MSDIIEVVICGEHEAVNRLKPGHDFTHLISIRDATGDRWSEAPSSAKIEGFDAVKHAIELRFDDCHDERKAKQHGWVMPAPEHIEAILKFANEACDWYNSMDDATRVKLLVHCAAGISRSTAAAYIFLCLFLSGGWDGAALGGGYEEQALDMVLAVRDIALPNKRMLHLADERLDARGQLLAAVKSRLGSSAI